MNFKWQIKVKDNCMKDDSIKHLKALKDIHEQTVKDCKEQTECFIEWNIGALRTIVELHNKRVDAQCKVLEINDILKNKEVDE